MQTHSFSQNTKPKKNGPIVARLQGVTHHYGSTVALDGLDLEIRAGEVMALLGPNGAGKTTAVSLLLGLLRPSEGQSAVFGHRPWSTAARRRTGAMLQISKVPETLTVGEHLELMASYYPRPLPLGETLETAGLEGLEKRLFGKLSGGQKQRTLFALSICGDPDLLFLDEPTTGLDVESRRELWQCVKRRAERGGTVLLTTHYLEEADSLASRVVVIDHGRRVAEGTPAEVKAKVGARRVRCRSRLLARDVDRWPDVEMARESGGHLEILTPQAEDVARRLLTADPDLADLEISGAGLEEALLTLTGRQAAAHHVPVEKAA